jgi:myo-inositol-hexaphosphate 3-phosphohydrolase
MNIAIDIHNNVYWTENGRIRKKDKETCMITVIFVFSPNFYSNFVMDNSQNIYFFNINKLHKYHLNTGAITNFMIPVIPKGNIYGMVLDNDTGDIYFTSEEIHSVYKTNISGKEPVTKISDNFKKPWGIAHDKSLN